MGLGGNIENRNIRVIELSKIEFTEVDCMCLYVNSVSTSMLTTFNSTATVSL